jgi:histidinol-phosphate aminotransferase
VRVGRERMMGGLTELGVPFFPSAANFVLMNIGLKHKELVQAMRTHDVLLRDRSTDPGCDGFVRITIGLEEHVTRGLEALRVSLNDIGWEAVSASTGAGTSDDVREFE